MQTLFSSLTPQSATSQMPNYVKSVKQCQQTCRMVLEHSIWTQMVHPLHWLCVLCVRAGVGCSPESLFGGECLGERVG